MLFLLISLLTYFCLLQYSGIQALSITYESIDCQYDPVYFNDVDVYLVEGRDAFFINFTIIDYLPVDAELRVALLQKTEGEYEVFADIDHTIPMCEALVEPTITGPLSRDLGLDANICPPKPGVYGNPYIAFDKNSFPYLPSNNYIMIFALMNEKKLLGESRTHFTVV